MIRAALFSLLLASLSACDVNPNRSADQPKSQTAMSSAELREKLTQIQQSNPQVPGFAVAIILPDGELISAATGVAAPDGRIMTPQTPVRLASLTKTFVAAAILRLVEEGTIQLDGSLEDYIEPDLCSLLASDGYECAKITVRQLLSHTSGLNDHFESDEYQAAIREHPERIWTAREQLEFFVDVTDKASEPGQSFLYSDPGYILLGLIIEAQINEPMGVAVRRLLKLDSIELNTSWWEGEAPPSDIALQAHQWVGDFDTRQVDGSFDAFGAAGLIASVEDTAQFYSALLSGRVFEQPNTLDLMFSAAELPPESNYRLGLFANEYAGLQLYGHPGIWGLDAVIVPDLNLTMVGVALEPSGVEAIHQLEGEILDSVRAHLNPG